ncbi:hypothetical protein ASPCADRAFT_205431 [Aspergillus carbonarius ITEM 5010]|uniref:Uncharacterized protein n=1 Tax=Aspergillus carbonarius (strain ITEM 5010) TaxID=602072 RepID=A0A1R3RUL1_ASPC5|nr:hypothetical protein ASPCADRAFT_205431 [Aspergillus carbonarius ITEM 5010]
MTADDIVSGLEALRALVRDPVTKTYALRLDYRYFEECIASWESKGYVQLNPDALVWTPYIMGRSNQSQFDRAPLHAVAPREDLEDEESEDLKESGNEEERQSPADADGSKDNDPVPLITNGTKDADSGQLPTEPAGPPSTDLLASANGFRHPTTTSAGSSTPAASNPAGDIPAWRFEIYPPVQAPASKRRPGRPFGSKTAKMPGTPIPVRTSGRNTPRRTSVLASVTPSANPPSVRRGRSAKLIDSPAVESTSVEPDGIENEPYGDLENTPAGGQDATSQIHVSTETELTSHAVAENELPALNGTTDPGNDQENEPTEHPAVEPVTPSKGKAVEGKAKLSKSVSRKSYVEKLELMVPAEDTALSTHENGIGDKAPVNGTDADGDTVMET